MRDWQLREVTGCGVWGMQVSEAIRAGVGDLAPWCHLKPTAAFLETLSSALRSWECTGGRSFLCDGFYHREMCLVTRLSQTGV